MKSRIGLVLSAVPLLLGSLPAMLRAADAPAAASTTDESLTKPIGEGWRPLFGDTLVGWKAEPDYWKVEPNGVLHGVTPGTDEHHYAYTEKSYGDIELHADVKLVGNNSGICIRLAPTSYDDAPGYQIDMGEGYWGALWEERGRGKLVDYPTGEAAKLVHQDDWNHYYVRADGHHIQAWLNGVKTIDVVDEQGRPTGRIGFQLCHGKGKVTDVSFKNVVWRPIEGANAEKKAAHQP